jgi:hypothetical protein
MARAEVQITAVDKTGNAIRTATNGLKTVERTAKITGKAINFAFGLLTGGALVAAFGKMTEAAKKTDEGRKALDDLARTLKDPTLVAAANSLTQGLVKGFNFALQSATAFIKVIRSELVSLGIIEARTKADALRLVDREISRIERGRGGIGIATRGAGGQMAVDAARAIEAELRVLREKRAIIAALANEEAKADQARISAEVAAERRASSGTGTGKSSGKRGQTLAEYIADLRRSQNAERAKALADWQADLLRETDQVLKKVSDSMADDVVEQVMKSNERQFGEKVTRMSIFAQEAARSMQSSFAEFLFDPFENGLKGMLSGFIGVIRRMLAELAAQQLLTSFFGAFAGGSGIVGQFASAALSGLQPRAKGGPVTGSTPYLVGERGPEMFIPGTGGTIVPNGGGMGGGVAVSYQIDARGATMDLAQALPNILADNNRRIFDELDRRYGIR